jgi:sugar O-acyltransferase (sialic acid O-acetyltransferase NeuD family)
MTETIQSQSPTKARKLAIFGAGGHGRELAWLAERAGWNKSDMFFVVDRPEYLAEEINGLPVRLLDDATKPDDKIGFVVALGDAAARERCATLCEQAGFTAIPLIHPGIELSPTVTIGQGSVICAGAILTVNIRIGRHVHINVGCTISHDAVLGDYATLSPGVNIAGHVQLGRHVFIGTGATIINGSSVNPLTIGDGAVIAAGACVTASVEEGAMVAGVPAVRKR